MQVSDKVVGILLAAGAGTRFGGDKGLATLPNGTAMAIQSAANLQRVVGDVLCVVRAEDARLQELFKAAGFETVICDDAVLGMSASLRAGVLASSQASGWLIALADMPLISEETYSGIIKQVDNQSALQIVVPVFEEQDGHPVYFSASFRGDLLALQGDKGAKKLLRQYPESVCRIIVSDSGVLQDFDTPVAFSDFFNTDKT